MGSSKSRIYLVNYICQLKTITELKTLVDMKVVYETKAEEIRETRNLQLLF